MAKSQHTVTGRTAALVTAEVMTDAPLALTRPWFTAKPLSGEGGELEILFAIGSAAVIVRMEDREEVRIDMGGLIESLVGNIARGPETAAIGQRRVTRSGALYTVLFITTDGQCLVRYAANPSASKAYNSIIATALVVSHELAKEEPSDGPDNA